MSTFTGKNLRKNLIKGLFAFTATTLFLTLFSCVTKFYPEYKLTPLPSNVNRTYLLDSLRYLSLAASDEKVVESTFSQDAQVRHKLMTFPKEAVRVLTIYDPVKNIQAINIISLKNGEDLYEASRTFSHTQGKLFRFPVNKYYNEVYSNIREEIIKSVISNSIVEINTGGIASVYGTLLAIELSELQHPIASILEFGATRFTNQESHDFISKKFGATMINISHEHDINHKIIMNNGATSILDEHIICETPKCYDVIYEQESFSRKEITEHISSYPHQYIQMYHDSLLTKM